MALFFATLSLLCLRFCLAASTAFRVVEHLTAVPDGWINVGAPAASQQITFRLAVLPERAADFEQKAINIATPGHEEYGKHMKRDEVKALLRPNSIALKDINAWLQAEGVPRAATREDGNWVKFAVPVSQAERMLNTTFSLYHNTANDRTVIRTLQYSVPQNIYHDVQLIQPTTRFGNFEPHLGRPSAGTTAVAATFDELTANCSAIVTPDCIRQLYGLYDAKAETDTRNRLGVSGYLGQSAQYSDFDSFMAKFAPNTTAVNYTVVSIGNGQNLQGPSAGSTEANMDLQYAASLADGALTTFYATGGHGPIMEGSNAAKAYTSTNEPYLDQLHFLLDLSDDDLPAVLSTSYGEDEQSVPESYAKVTCSMFAQLGARGVSIIFSSGDSGVGKSCVMNDGTNRKRFIPTFPASCPFVTSVGGTSGTSPEKAIAFSGGGFSERFPRPHWQEGAVAGYLRRLGSEWKGLYNQTGRGIPDVAAQASNYLIVDQGRVVKASGTSAAAPVFAAIISQLNSVRLAHNQPRLGFLNPWLYSLNQTGFTDIVNGSSTGCTGQLEHGDSYSAIPFAGWNATEGWDPVTGLGTPFFHTLAQVVRSPHPRPPA